ncbi:MAG: LuxR C-terminal-related transcriptional regulator [Crocinitomicaceae bacterium]
MTSTTSFINLLWVILFIPLFAIGQEEKEAIENIKAFSTTQKRLELYLDEAERRRRYDYYFLVDLINESLKEDSIGHYPEYEVKLRILLGRTYMNLELIYLSEREFSKAESITKSSGLEKLLPKLYLENSEVILRNRLIPLDEKKQYFAEKFNRAKELIKKSNIHELEGETEFVQGLYYLLYQNSENASLYLERSQKCFKNIMGMDNQRYKFQIEVLGSLGNTKRIQGNLNEARHYFERSLVLANEYQYLFEKTIIYINLIEIESESDNLDLALNYGYQALKIDKNMYRDGVSDKAKIHYLMAGLYEKKEMSDSSLAHHIKSFELTYTNRFERAQYENKLTQNILLTSEADKIKSQHLEGGITELVDLNHAWKIGFFIAFFLTALLLFLYLLLLRKRIRSKNYSNRARELSIQLNKSRDLVKQKEKQISEVIKTTSEMGSVIQLLANDNPNSISIRDLALKIKSVNKNLHRERKWEDFQETFQQEHPDFRQNLIKKFPKLSQNELKIAIYLKGGLSVNEIANIKGISTEGTRTAIKRLGNKLNITNKKELIAFLDDF